MKKCSWIAAAALLLTGCGGTVTGGMPVQTTDAAPAETTTSVVTTTNPAETTAATDTTSEATTTEATTTAPVRDWNEALDERLAIEAERTKDYLDNNPGGPAYEIIDLNGDQIPELVVSDSEVHAAACVVFQFDGKTYERLYADDDAQGFGSYGWMSVCLDEHLILSAYGGMGYVGFVYYRFEGSTLHREISFTSDEAAVGEADATYTINNEAVSRAEYEAELAKYQSLAFQSCGRNTASF